MHWSRHVAVRRISGAVVAAMLLVWAAPGQAQTQTAAIWGALPLQGGAPAAREVLLLGDPDGRLDASLLVDFVRRYANTDVRAAATRFERHLSAVRNPSTDAGPHQSSSSLLPLPLPDFWRRALGADDEELLLRLLRSRTALLTYHGLMGVETGTLAQLSQHPALLQGFLSSGTASAAFATFGSSLRIGTEGVVTPGDDADGAVWQHLVGQPPSNVEAFADALFRRDGGRLAWFYDTVSQLPEATQQFVLAADRSGDDRLATVQTIYSRFVAVDAASWRIETRPFHRPPFDAALALMVLDLNDGRVGPAWWPALFDDLTEGAVGASRARPTDAPARATDAAWFFEWVFAQPAQARDRFVALRFAQRLFASSSPDAAPHLRVVLGRVLDMPLLMLSLERMGVRDPETLAAVAVAAHRATHAGGEGRVLPALARWQAALGLLEQIQRRVVLPDAQLSMLLHTLAAAAPTHPEASAGSVAAWMHDHLLPALVPDIAAGGTVEDLFLQAATTPRTEARPVFQWEGLPYVIDEPGSVLRSAAAIRRARPGPQLDDVFELLRVRRAVVAAGAAESATTRQLVERLERLVPVFALITNRDDPRVRNFARVVQTVGASTGARLPQQLNAITAALDALTEVVTGPLLYALAVSPTSEPVLYPEAWTRHTLARPGELPTAASRPWREMAWQLPTDYGFGGGTRLVGAYLALDVALADAQLARIPSDELPVPGVIDDPMRRGLVEPLALGGADTSPHVLSSRLADLEAGRTLVAAWTAAAPDAETLSRALRMATVDVWRTNLLVWKTTQLHPSALQTLTLSELVWLGATRADRPEDGDTIWSGSSRLLDGCLCRAPARRVTHEQLRGRRLGIQALRPHDITFRLAELLTSLDLDLVLVSAVLPMALQDWLDRSRPAWSDDWEAFTSWPHMLSGDRVEQYLLQLVSTGVFSPPAPEESPR